MGGGASKKTPEVRPDDRYKTYLRVTQDILDPEAKARLSAAIDEKVSVEQWYQAMNARYGTRTRQVIMETIIKVRASTYKWDGIYGGGKILDENDDMLYVVFMEYLFYRTPGGHRFIMGNGHLLPPVAAHLLGLLETKEPQRIVMERLTEGQVYTPYGARPNLSLYYPSTEERRVRDRDERASVVPNVYILDCVLHDQTKGRLIVKFQSKGLYQQYRAVNWKSYKLVGDVSDMLLKKYGQRLGGPFAVKDEPVLVSADSIDLEVKYGPDE